MTDMKVKDNLTTTLAVSIYAKHATGKTTFAVYPRKRSVLDKTTPAAKEIAKTSPRSISGIFGQLKTNVKKLSYAVLRDGNLVPTVIKPDSVQKRSFRTLVKDLTEETKWHDVVINNTNVYFIPLGMCGTVRSIAQTMSEGYDPSGLSQQKLKNARIKVYDTIKEFLFNELAKTTPSPFVLSYRNILKDGDYLAPDSDAITVAFNADSFKFANSGDQSKLEHKSYIRESASTFIKFLNAFFNKASEGNSKALHAFLVKECKTVVSLDEFIKMRKPTEVAVKRVLDMKLLVYMSLITGSIDGLTLIGVPESGKITKKAKKTTDEDEDDDDEEKVVVKEDEEDEEKLVSYKFVKNSFKNTLSAYKEDEDDIEKMLKTTVQEENFYSSVDRFMDYGKVLSFKVVGNFSGTSKFNKDGDVFLKLVAVLRSKLNLKSDGSSMKKTTTKRGESFPALFQATKGARRYLLIDDYSTKKHTGITLSNSTAKNAPNVLFNTPWSSEDAEELVNLLSHLGDIAPTDKNRELLANAFKHCLAVGTNYYKKDSEGKKIAPKKLAAVTEEKKKAIMASLSDILGKGLGVTTIRPDHLGPSASRRKTEQDMSDGEEEEDEEEEEEEEEEKQPKKGGKRPVVEEEEEEQEQEQE